MIIVQLQHTVVLKQIFEMFAIVVLILTMWISSGPVESVFLSSADLVSVYGESAYKLALLLWHYHLEFWITDNTVSLICPDGTAFVIRRNEMHNRLDLSKKCLGCWKDRCDCSAPGRKLSQFIEEKYFVRIN